MQIVLKKVFYDFPWCNVGQHQWDREEEHLDRIKRICQRASTQGEPTVCVRKILNITALLSVPTRWRTYF